MHKVYIHVIYTWFFTNTLKFSIYIALNFLVMKHQFAVTSKHTFLSYHVVLDAIVSIESQLKMLKYAYKIIQDHMTV